MEEREQHLLSEQDLLRAQLAKLNLEIESLRKRNPWEPYSQFLPLAAAIVAFVGLSIGFIQFNRGQQTQQHQFNESQAAQNAQEQRARAADQRIRLQNQIRVDGEELLRFVQDRNETPAKVSFLFGLLNATVETNSDSGDQSISEEFARPLTDSLVGLITEDSGFERSPRNVVFASKALDNWDDYKKYLSENPALLRRILYEHTRAIRYLRDTNPDYLQRLFYNEDSKDIDHPKHENEKGEEVRYQRFVDVWESFKDHVKFADELIATAKREGKDVSKIELQKNIVDFEGALCNSKIAPHILKGYSSAVPCEIKNRLR